jgi:class 3 adenylate cyclase/tetratricopeptide (TPR) repeat protein
MTTLQCSRCGTANRAGRRYCAHCGARLPVACPACGYANEAGEKFCGGCGAPLAAPGIAADAPAGAPVGGAPTATGATATTSPGSDGERRPVTVLFADLVDYTRMSRALDPEDVHAMLERFYAAADGTVERFGGSIDKHIGDSVMAVFGAPVAHDDDAVRALRAAAEIHRAMPTVAGATGEPLAVHIGIASGEVVASGLGGASHRAYTVIGNSVNLAARLLTLAGAGETVTDDAVHATAQRIARCVPIEGAQLKGIDAPLTAWRFVDFADATDREGEHAFVGRTAELAQLQALLASCAANGTGGTVLVRGDAGIGKSRLVGELRRRALADGFACHTGLVLDFGMAKGRDAIGEIVASLMDLPRGSDGDARCEALRQMLTRHPALAKEEPFLRDLLDLPQPAEGAAMYAAMDSAARQRGRAAAVVRLLEAACADSPVLVSVEDVHWADPVTLDHLAALTRGAGTMAAVLALTSRVAGDPLDAAWRGSVQGSPLLTIDLGPLGTRDALALAGGFLSAPRALVQKCVERAGGNPLFLEQLMRAADESDKGLPASLHSLVLARMDRLPERDRAALRAAAVVGQRFPLALVRHLAQLADYSCAVPVAHFLVRPEGDDFLFAHALIRDGVYASLTRARRAELHRAAAEWYGERDPALRAEHLDRAEAPEAPRAYRDAALAQATALQPERALALAERGAALARDPEDVVALNMLRGRLRCESGEGQPAVGAYEIALAAAERPAERCRALIGIAAGQRLIAGVDKALAALAEAEPLARAPGLERELSELHYTRGNLYFARGDISGCAAAHEAALACARSLDDPAWEARALSGLADAAYAAGRMRTARARYRQCVELCDAHGLTRVAIPNRVLIGFCRCFLMEFDGGIADIDAARSLAVRIGDRHVEVMSLESQGILLSFCDRHADAEPFLARGLALAETIGARRFQSIVLAGLAACALAAGRVSEAGERIERALALARETGMGFCGPMLLGLRARLLDGTREREQCRAEAEALLAQGCASHNVIDYHRQGIEDALARSEWPRGLEHAAALDAYTRAEPLPYSDFLIARARVLIGLASRPADQGLREDLARLRADAKRVRWPIAWPAWAPCDDAPPAAAP